MMMLFACGSNGSGQLGISSKDDVSSPQQCILVPHKDDESPIQLVAGGNHTLLLFPSGTLYCAGSNRDGRGGLDRSIESVDVFCEVDLNLTDPGIKLCAATWEATVIITKTNDVYTVGNGPKGELGNGCTTAAAVQKLPGFPPPDVDIVDVSSSIDHVVVVLSSGEVYGWGNGRKGQLGETAELVWIPRKIPSVAFSVARAVCGRDFTYLVAAPADGRHVILGNDKWRVRSNAPANASGWKDIEASWGSTYVLKDTGNVESWGRDDHGQLAPSNLPPIERLAVGSEHALAMTTSKQIISWGWGEHGNCGPHIDDGGHVKHQWNQIDLITASAREFPAINGIAAGCATSFIWI